jgi:hypothetical protein
MKTASASPRLGTGHVIHSFHSIAALWARIGSRRRNDCTVAFEVLYRKPVQMALIITKAKTLITHGDTQEGGIRSNLGDEFLVTDVPYSHQSIHVCRN